MNNNSRLKNATYSIIFTSIYELVVFISSLILPRLILATYGSEYNGIVSSISQFLGIVSILRIGIAGATRVELYKSLNNNDIEQTSRIIKSTELYMKKISLIFGIYLLLLALLYPLFVSSSYSFLNIASLIIIIGIATFAEYLFGFTYYTLLQSDQKLYVYNIIQTIAIIINVIISFLLIKANCSIQIVKLFSSIIFAASPIVLYYYVSRKYKINKNAYPDNTAIKNRGYSAAHSIANIINENTDIVILTIFTNIKIVSVYTVYNLVIKGLKQLLTVFTIGLESIFGSMWAKKEYDKIEYNLNLYEFFIFAFSSVVFSCTFLLIIPFVKLYTSGVTDIEYIVPTFAIIIITAQFFYSIRMPYQTIIQALGKYKETKKIAWTEAIMNIIISIILVFNFGLVGVAIGTLFANAYRTISYSNYISTNLFKRPKFKLIKRIIWALLNIFITIIIYNIVIKAVEFECINWNTWIISGIIIFGIITIVTIINSIIFYKKDFCNCLNIFKRLIHKKSKK